jgi:putative transferase (TIGR04331 family)
MAIFGTTGYADFQYWHINDEGRELYAAEYFRTFYPGQFEEKPLVKTAYQEKRQASWLRRLVEKVSRSFSPLAVLCSIAKKIIYNREKVLVVGVAHNNDMAAKLYLRSLGKVNFANSLPSAAYTHDPITQRDGQLRSRVSRAITTDGCRYEKYLSQCIEITLPWIIAEGFEVTYKMYRAYWRSFPKLKYVLAENRYQDDAMGFAVFNAIGGNLVNVPHFVALDIFAANQPFGLNVFQDKVLSRGCEWVNENTKAVGTLYPYGVGKIKKRKAIDILFIATDFYPYFLSYEQSADGTGEVVSKIFSDFTEKLFNSIPKKIVKRISVKKRAEHACIQIHNSYPSDVVMLNAALGAKEYMSEANLVVVEGVSTAFLESLVSDIPSLNYIPENLYEFAESKENYYSDLVDAGIMHDDPLKLAAKIIEVQANPADWWNSVKIQEARRSFLYKNLNSSMGAYRLLLSLAER